MNRLPIEKSNQIIAFLVEGMSMRAVSGWVCADFPFGLRHYQLQGTVPFLVLPGTVAMQRHNNTRTGLSQGVLCNEPLAHKACLGGQCQPVC